MYCNKCNKELDFQYNPIGRITKAFGYNFKFYCKSCILNQKQYNEVLAQKFGFVINRMTKNNLRIITLNKINKSEGIQLVIDYLHNENKNLLNLLK